MHNIESPIKDWGWDWGWSCVRDRLGLNLELEGGNGVGADVRFGLKLALELAELGLELLFS